MEKDFEQLYPNVSLKLYAEWAKLSAFIEKKISKIDAKFKPHSNPGIKIYNKINCTNFYPFFNIVSYIMYKRIIFIIFIFFLY